MEKNVKISIALALAVSGLMATASVSMADTLDDILANKVIRVGIDLGKAPYGMLDADAKPTGSDYESAKQLADDWGVELELVPVVGSSRIPFLLSGKVDVVFSALGITEERMQVIDFSKPYGVFDVAVFGPPGDSTAEMKDLVGKTIAVPRGTMPDTILTKATADLAGVTIKRYEDDATVGAALATGQETFAGTSTTLVVAYRESTPSLQIEKKFVLSVSPYGIGVRKGEDRLKAALDKWVDDVVANGRLNDITIKYFGEPLDPSISP